ncbi:hypothetical protein [Chryseobacterium lactis]|uniref:hypothetical protein n=1 Tax=Chryseobacterium lactis TaxID=1241981 RepID=UPI0016248CE4|nr:hypothetical protein [Chryseobacterium lactis]
MEIDPLKNEAGLVNIEGEGRLHDERSIYDFIGRSPFSMIIEDNPVMNDQGNFRIQYYLNGKTQLPESLYLECRIMLKEEKKVSVVIAAVSE